MIDSIRTESTADEFDVLGQRPQSVVGQLHRDPRRVHLRRRGARPGGRSAPRPSNNCPANSARRFCCRSRANLSVEEIAAITGSNFENSQSRVRYCARSFARAAERSTHERGSAESGRCTGHDAQLIGAPAAADGVVRASRCGARCSSIAGAFGRGNAFRRTSRAVRDFTRPAANQPPGRSSRRWRRRCSAAWRPRAGWMLNHARLLSPAGTRIATVTQVSPAEDTSCGLA